MGKEISKVFSGFLDPQTVVYGIPKFKEPRIVQDWVLWLEQRPDEGGRTTIMIRPWSSNPSFQALELTPFPINVKSQIHGYGGAPFAIANSGNLLFISWVDNCDGCLWFQTWFGLENNTQNINLKLKRQGEQLCLSSKGKFSLGDGLIDLTRNRWVGVMEKENKDYLVSYQLDQKLRKPKILYQGKDFIGYISINHLKDKMAWVEWHRPYMPWDYSYLKVANIDKLGDIPSQSILDISFKKNLEKFSIFQPIWLDSEELVVISDISGWWNIIKIILSSKSKNKYLCEPLFPIDAEFALPQWISGMSTISISSGKIFSLSTSQGTWDLNLMDSTGLWKKIPLPFDNLSDLYADKDRLIMIASNPQSEPALLQFEVNSGIYYSEPARESNFNLENISVGELFIFEGFDGHMTHSWYYPPIPKINKPTPLLVKAHSGPTSMSCRGLDLEVQFWTSRGWSVLDVNYGGSTGFGRSYRDRLKNKWGIVDVVDCNLAAKALVKEGRVDRNLIAIIGSSSGGFTALNCLQSFDTFSVAACKYPVTDLVRMATKTHRFEEGYLDYLVGPFDQRKDLYLTRSPINNLSNINSPVIFFQGLKDKVVCPDQTNNMFNLLKNKGVPVEIHNFPNEGHGFVDGHTKTKVLIETEKFFSKYLKL